MRWKMPKTITRDDGETVTATHTATMYGVPLYLHEPSMTTWGRGVLADWFFEWVPEAAQSVVNATLWTLGMDTLDGWPFNNVREIEAAP